MNTASKYVLLTAIMVLVVFSAINLFPPLSGTIRLWWKAKTGFEAHTMPLICNIYSLKDLDKGDVGAARKQLNISSMECLFCIWASIGNTTNVELLYKQPGLRAAAQYWGIHDLPTDTMLTIDGNLSNQTYNMLQSVLRESNRRRTNGIAGNQ